ncbi:hypothetical protein QAD02_017807 [Eretmocerus hayati]|uniref:Uncharacterized protein n=1 Tax=Eretmocerus hayati TaxID=131215 RepID=A0ACC2PEM5_9HYME|nr:hypothetical protein QAD02_017807 [Eretmocerus hayati]
MKDLHEYSLTAVLADYFPLEIASFLEMLREYLNFKLRVVSPSEKLGSSYVPALGVSHFNGSEQDNDVIVDMSSRSIFLEGNDEIWMKYYKKYLYLIPIPIFNKRHFYLRRPKIYVMDISFAAILAFGGLIFTAFIFAVWAQFLGFRERNWSFLNILTAQMGGSLERRGRMKLSEMVFQMSIYVATFIVVTLGSDYMYEIFILRQELTTIKTMQDLVDSNVNLIMGSVEYSINEEDILNLVKNYRSPSKLLNRIQTRELAPGTSSFCIRSWAESLVIDETVNLCIEYSVFDEFILRSTDDWQVDKIEDPISVSTEILVLTRNPFFKNRLQESMYPLMEAGLFVERQKDVDEYRRLENGLDQLHLQKNETDKVPFQDQLQPILGIGYAVAFTGFFLELVWKIYIEKTELGRAVHAFYSDSRSNSANSVIRRRQSSRMILVREMINVELRDRVSANQVRTRCIDPGAVMNDEESKRITAIAEVHQQQSDK